MEIFLASNLKLLRKRKGRTQDDVAIAINLKRTSYCGIELGNALPGLESLIALSNYFGVAVDYLTEGRSATFISLSAFGTGKRQ